MSRRRKIILFFVFLLLILFAIYFYFKIFYPPVITIRDSASTNTRGFVITINPDGSGEAQVYEKGTSLDTSNPISLTQFDSGTFDYTALEKSITTVPITQSYQDCMKPASFDDLKTVAYKGKTGEDIICVPDTPEYRNLIDTIQKMLVQAHINTN